MRSRAAADFSGRPPRRWCVGSGLPEAGRRTIAPAIQTQPPDVSCRFVTLHISVTTPTWAVHTGDRLLTQRGAVWHEENKLIVLRAMDGLLALSFWGTAHVGRVPTDQWIVEAIVDRGVYPDMGIRFGPNPGITDVGAVMRRIRDRLSQLPARWRGPGSGVAATGFQWRRKGRKMLPRPVIWSIWGRPGGGGFEVASLLPRYFHLSLTPAYGVIDQPHGWLRPEDSQTLSEALVLSEFEPEAIERAAVRAIQAVADRPGSIVGANCMGIRIGPGEEFLVVNGRFWQRPGDPPAGFSPWVIGPDTIVPPSKLLGTWTVRTGRVLVTLEAPPGTDLLAGWARDPRRPAPR